MQIFKQVKSHSLKVKVGLLTEGTGHSRIIIAGKGILIKFFFQESSFRKFQTEQYTIACADS